MATQAGPNTDQEHQAGTSRLSSKTLRQIFQSEQFADITLKYGETTVRANKQKLSKKSGFWKQKLKSVGPNGVWSLEGPDSKAISLHATEAFRSAIEYCYTGEYSIPDHLRESASQMELTYFHVFVHHFAKGFRIEGLAAYAAEKYVGEVAVFSAKQNDENIFQWMRDVFTFDLADKHTHFMMYHVAEEQYYKRVEKLVGEGEFKEVFQRMREFPSAAANFFMRVHASNNPSEAMEDMGSEEVQEEEERFDWKCDNCRNTLWYTGNPGREDLKLPICPSCPNMDDHRLGKTKKQVSKKRKTDDKDDAQGV